jgi:hypothetical protein
MRFAWLRDNSPDSPTVNQGCTHPLSLIRKAYNAAFWIFLIPFLTAIDYGTGFIAFTVIILARLALNLVTNNWLDLEPHQYETYPFRV